MFLCPRRFPERFLGSAAERPYKGRAVHRISENRFVLYWPTKQGDARQKTGLLYTPELLASLIANQPPEIVPTLLGDAVQQQTPIVVMWTIPPMSDAPPWPRPFSGTLLLRRAIPSAAS